MARLSISVLGPLAVTLDGEPVVDFEYNKVRALLVYLAVESHRSHTRDSLAALLWPDLPEQVARKNLSQALAKLRLALGEKTAAVPFLLVHPDGLQLNPDGDFEVDAARFLSLIDVTEAHPHRSWRACSLCAGQLRQVVGLYRGDFLAQFFLPDSTPFEEWASLKREHLRQRVLSALERLVEWAEWRSQHGQALDYARRQVELQPLLELNQRTVMRLLVLTGQRAAALAQYDQLRRTLASEVAANPEAETTTLYEQIKSGAIDSGPVSPAGPESYRLPSPPTRLIGREREVQAVFERLQVSGIRALTLLGPPGVGKTRLALAIANALRFDFEDGVRFVELAPIDNPALVPQAVAQALDVKDQSGQPPAEAVTTALHDRHLLLVLDNFEHVLDAAAFVAGLLAACPALRIVVTSRVPLGIRAEHQFPLPALSLPETRASFEVIAASPAIQLFVERAQAAQTGFALTAENADAVADICARLDGLPLAIELSAVRARTFSPAELLKHLDQRLKTLDHGPRDLPARHRSLRSAIQWSYERLSEGEQRLFAHLGVFSGGCTAEAARAVTGAPHPIQPLLETLHEASLLQIHLGLNETRFTQLETIREFAVEQLAAQGALVEAQRRHAEYFLSLACEAEARLVGKDQAAWLERVAREHANMRAAMGWSLSQGNDLGLRLSSALNHFWSVRGLTREGRRWLEEGLAQSKEVPDSVRAKALWSTGRLALIQGDLTSAQAMLGESLQLYTQLEDLSGLGRAHVNLGWLALERGLHAEAQSHLQEGLACYRRLGDERATASALNGLGLVGTRMGEYEAARQYYEQTLDIVRRTEDSHFEAVVLNNLGESLRAEGDFDAARRNLEASRAMFARLGNSNGLAMVLVNLSELDELSGDLASAQQRCAEAIAISEIRYMANAGHVLNALGRIERRMGNLDIAHAHHREALTLRYGAGNQWGVAVSLLGLAYVAGAARQFVRAARLMGAAEALRQAIGSPLEPALTAEHQAAVAALQAALGESTLARAWAEGRALTVDQVVALARGD
jgi:predicted ATPase/DNA-binding SARP family transcriptional activator